MKRLIIILLMLPALRVSAGTKTTITGIIASYADTTVPVRLEICQYENFEQQMRYVSTELTNGNFTLSFDLDRTSIVAVSVNNNAAFLGRNFYLLLRPGDDITFIKKDHKKVGFFDVEFTGSGAAVHNFYKKVFGPLSNLQKQQFASKPYINRSIQERFSYNFNVRRLADSLCAKYRDMVDSSLYKYARANVLRSIYEEIFLYIEQTQEISPELTTMIEQYILPKKIMEDMLVDDVTRILIPITTFRTYAFVKKNLTTGYQSDNSFMVKRPIEALKAIAKAYENYPFARSLVMGNMVYLLITKNGKSREMDEIINEYTNIAFQNDTIKYQILRMYKKVGKTLTQGMPFLNFELTNLNGGKTTLRDYIGKVLVIDFYFKGCPGCKGLTPLMEELETVINDKRVKFLSVSIDRDSKSWKEGIGIYSSKTSDQLFTGGGSNHPLIEFSAISSYPSLLIVDANGNFFSKGKDPRTYGMKAIIEQINSALSK